MVKKKILRSKKDSKKEVGKGKAKKKLSFAKLLRNKKLIRSLILLLGAVALGIWLFWGIPLPTTLTSQDFPVSTKLFDRNGKLIFEIYGQKRRTPVELENLPEYVKTATVAIEDKDFYKHRGYSLTGIIRAAYNTALKRKLQGGSTLTQQLVKNALLTPERTIRRKAREFVLSVIVEALYSKDQILEMYLNQTPYGSTAYGIEAAAELYFDKSAAELSLSEATLLAGLPQAPSRYSPFGAYPENAKARQETVLTRMLEQELIAQPEFEHAKEEELKFTQTSAAPKAPHFALWVKQQLAERYGEAVVEQGGLRVTTTLDLDLQEIAQTAVAEEIADLDKYKVGNGAALITRPASGEILAMVGSKDYFAEDEDGKVNVILAKRQPGSSIKPLNYALAFRDKKITPATALADVPTCFAVVGQKLYCPRNYDWAFHGIIQARFALGNSYNIPAVRVLALNGVENFVEFAFAMGISTFTDPSQYGLSLTLGGGEVKPYDMAVAFGVFANQGIKQPLVSILKVEDWKGKVLEETELGELDGDRVLTPDVSFLISHILHDNNARSAAFGSSSFLNVRGHPEVSVKTGTTNDLRDNWTIGYTTHVLALTWVGNNDNTPMSASVSGVSGASPIWNTIMREALDKAEEGNFNVADEGHSWPRKDNSVAGANVCATTGNFPTGSEEDPGCPTRFEYLLAGTQSIAMNTGMQDVQIDKTTQALAGKDTPPEDIEPQHKQVFFDPLGTLYCLDCAPPVAPITIRYPLQPTNPTTQ